MTALGFYMLPILAPFVLVPIGIICAGVFLVLRRAGDTAADGALRLESRLRHLHSRYRSLSRQVLRITFGRGRRSTADSTPASGLTQ